MSAEKFYKEQGGIELDKFDKKAPKFDYYYMLDFAEEYNKKQLELFAEWLEYNGKYMTHKDQIKSFLKTN